ncbi:lysophospholipid acyltransferase family protein [Stutzerimonas kirkiae]|uniref:lysophospholipid acyltransferase family protein n=1 Tax=Stutzerimonas kirkiae TaxID=2211392 RepID=UPI001038443D|nr:lysophospholipid acyltransferase family protein [Stutzerimonas kirkiae]TBV09737.1 1-acyl-sn-glycerol-3-phosphate acyltransferase [Stutzerimonas kirkiae]TBV13533.1 1-acyl-sn-glycerol-3-phosphate acyltransferase [Stutzerimonas kirkiae]
MGRLLRLRRYSGLLTILGHGLLTASWLTVRERCGRPPSLARRQYLTRQFLERIGRQLPYELRIVGEPPRQSMLWVANHVSWVDIVMLGRVMPLSFLSKDDVAQWPLIGWLAHHAGTCFIRRGAGEHGQVGQQLQDYLRREHPLLIFPEGTTSDGTGVRTFHPRLLGCALETATPVQPVAIRYRRHDQADPLSPFLGDDELTSHLQRLLASGQASVEIHFLPPIQPHGLDRSTLARRARESIAAVLADEQPATPTARCA